MSLTATLLLALAYFAHTAESVCFCPRVCLPTYHDSCKYRDRTLCIDYEAAQECISANSEITDAVNSMGRNADLFLMAAVENGTLAPAAASFLRTRMTLAMEDEKPVGDCEAGAATDTLVAGTNSHCFSVPVWSQCVNLRDGVSAWAFGIRGKLNATIFRGDVPLALAGQFVAAMGERAEANTARIRCAAHEVAADQMNSATRMLLELWSVAASVVLIVALVMM